MIERLRTLDNIVRLDRAEDMHAYVARGEPFITAGVLAGTFLAAVDDREHVIRTFGAARVAQRDRPVISLAEYFVASEYQPGSIVAELSPDLDAQLTELARRPPLACAEPASVVWIGRAGCKQRFHCDMDCAGIFLAQAMGAKRVCLVSPAASQKLQPGLDRVMLLSEVPFQLADDDERLRFLAFVDGKDTVLGAGETLFIPPLWWHFVHYVTDCVAISWHSAPSARLAEAHRAWPLLWKQEWPLWQGIVSRLGSDPALADRHAARFDAVLASITRGESGTAGALRELHDELCPGRYVRALAPSDAPFFERRVERPLPAKTDPWCATDLPRTQPYVRFALAHARDRAALVVLDGRTVIAELAVDNDDTEALATIATAVGEAPAGTSVAALAAELDCEVDDLCAALAELSTRGWVTAARSA